MEKSNILDDSEHWLNRAGEARALADDLNDPETRRSMLRIADEYERLAERARERAANGGSP